MILSPHFCVKDFYFEMFFGEDLCIWKKCTIFAETFTISIC